MGHLNALVPLFFREILPIRSCFAHICLRFCHWLLPHCPAGSSPAQCVSQDDVQCSYSLFFVSSFPLTGHPWPYRPQVRGCGVTEGRSMNWGPGRQSMQFSSSLPFWGDKQVKGTLHYEWLLSKTKAWPLSSVTGTPQNIGLSNRNQS